MNLLATFTGSSPSFTRSSSQSLPIGRIGHKFSIIGKYSFYIVFPPYLSWGTWSSSATRRRRMNRSSLIIQKHWLLKFNFNFKLKSNKKRRIEEEASFLHSAASSELASTTLWLSELSAKGRTTTRQSCKRSRIWVKSFGSWAERFWRACKFVKSSCFAENLHNFRKNSSNDKVVTFVLNGP